MRAAECGQIEIVKYHAEQRLPLHTANPYGFQAIHFAATAGRPEVIRFLLQHDADLTATTAGGWSPLYCAAFYGNPEAFKVLAETILDRGGKLDPAALEKADDNGLREVVKYLKSKMKSKRS